MASKRIPDCHPLSLYGGRGLCKPCYRRHAKAGTLERFPRFTVPGSDFAERYTAMRAAGLPRSAMTEPLGMDLHAIAQAYYRAIRRGSITPDPERVSCGTDAGYQAHWRRNEAACQPCKDAWAAAQRARYHRTPRLAAEGTETP